MPPMRTVAYGSVPVMRGMKSDERRLYMFHDMFVHDMFISPDLDGHRAPKMKYCPI